MVGQPVHSRHLDATRAYLAGLPGSCSSRSDSSQAKPSQARPRGEERRTASKRGSGGAMSSVRSVLSLFTVALLWAMSASAPLPESSGDPELLQFVQKNREFVLRIKQDVSRIRKLMLKQFKIGSDNELMLMQEMLGISQVDLSLCRTEPCDLTGCFNQIRTGLHTYQGYFSRIKEILPDFAGHIDGLQADVTNLSSNLQRQMQESGLTVVAYPQTESQANPSFLESEREIGSYLVLRNFEKFLEMTFRALRHCSS